MDMVVQCVNVSAKVYTLMMGGVRAWTILHPPISKI